MQKEYPKSPKFKTHLTYMPYNHNKEYCKMTHVQQVHNLKPHKMQNKSKIRKY